jgi:glycerol uptake facilitator-like aquaporin
MDLVWKFITEFLGTFMLVLVLIYSNNSPLAVGGTVAGIIWLGKDRSGAHINPAVSLVRYLGGKLSMNELAGYVASQIAGAIACLYMFKVFA